MLKRLLKRSSILQEYVGELKVTYQLNELDVINYQRIISIYDQEVVLQNILVKGSELKVIYQDPVKVKIKGKINSVIEREENGI